MNDVDAKTAIPNSAGNGHDAHNELRDEPASSAHATPRHAEASTDKPDLHTFVFDTVLEGMHTSIYVTDPETDEILYMNGYMKQEYGVESPEGKVCWQVLQKDRTQRCDFCPVPVLQRSGEENPLVQWDEVSPINGRAYRNYDSLVIWVDGRRVHLQQSVDITEVISANTDELTGMFARRAGKEELAASMVKASEAGTPLSIALYDINCLKEVNDQYGHAEGDHYIRSVAQAVRQVLNEDEYGLRLSGDEFVVVLSCEASEAHERMERARASLTARSTLANHSYEQGFCFGVAEMDPEAPLEMYELLAQADRRMYDEKRSFHIELNLEALNQSKGQGASSSEFTYDHDRLYDALFESTDDYLYVCNMRTGVFRYPRAMVEEFDLPSEVVENAAAVWGSKVHPDDRQAFLESNQEIADARTTQHWVEYRAINRKGEWVRLRCRGRLILDEKGKPSLFAGFITNLGKKSKVDPLTGLFNKFEFEDVMRHRMEETPDEPIGLMVVGIDDLRHINDRYDRAFGDDVIRFVAHRIQSAAPESARIYRLDGDEFAIAVRDDLEVLRATYATLSGGFERQQEHAGKKFYCTLSGGCACYPGDAGTYEDLLKYANYALEFAKGHGKKRCENFSKSILAERTRTLELNELLRDSVEHGFKGFSVHYQPQVDAKTKRIVGAEALARWQCEEYGSLPPLEFIPLLEESGLIVPVGRWVLQQAVTMCKRWSAIEPAFVMSVNLSYRQIDEESLVEVIHELLDDASLPADNLVVEMTESHFAPENVVVKRLFDEIRSLGVRVAMDDFGTGYSALGVLKLSPADIVKIDKTFIRDIQSSSFDATFIRFIVELCHDVGIHVCLEGVETDDEYEAVTDMGLDYIQGFLFGKPMPPEEFEKMLLASRA